MSDVPGEERMPKGRMPVEPKSEKAAGHTKNTQSTPKLMEGRGKPVCAPSVYCTPGKHVDGLKKYAQQQEEHRGPVIAPSVRAVGQKAPGKVNS